MRATASLRVSTEEQAKLGDSLQAQRAEVIAYCERQGYTLWPEDIHTDEGISGKSLRNREGLARAMDKVETLAKINGEAVLVVFSVSRMARNVRDAYTVLDRLRKAGATLESVSEKLDLSTAAGRMMFGILVVLAQYKVEETAEQTAATLRNKASRGERTGALPIGLRVIETGATSKRGKPVATAASAEELEAIDTIVRLYDASMGPRAIARTLTAARQLARNGKPWAESTIRGILKRERPKGESQVTD